MLYKQQCIITLFVIRNFYDKTGAINISVQEIKEFYSKAILCWVDNRGGREAELV